MPPHVERCVNWSPHLKKSIFFLKKKDICNSYEEVIAGLRSHFDLERRLRRDEADTQRKKAVQKMSVKPVYQILQYQVRECVLKVIGCNLKQVFRSAFLQSVR